MKKRIISLALSTITAISAISPAAFSYGSATDEKSDMLTKEEFLDKVVSETEDFFNGGFVYRGDLKFDAISNGDGWDLVIYGIKEEDYEPNIKLKEGAVIRNYKEYMEKNGLSLRDLALDMVWMQINSNEFLYNH